MTTIGKYSYDRAASDISVGPQVLKVQQVIHEQQELLRQGLRLNQALAENYKAQLKLGEKWEPAVAALLKLKPHDYWRERPDQLNLLLDGGMVQYPNLSPKIEAEIETLKSLFYDLNKLYKGG